MRFVVCHLLSILPRSTARAHRRSQASHACTALPCAAPSDTVREASVAIYKVRSFDRFARKHRIVGEDLAVAARDLFAGRFDADLGGGVFKQRMARNGAGKSGGFRVLVMLRAN